MGGPASAVSPAASSSCSSWRSCGYAGAALVRTLHNVTPHEPPTWLQARALRLSDRATTLWITLTERTQPPTSAPAVIVPHGHYRDWFARAPHVERVPGRLLHFGRVRPYKGLGSLLAAFSRLPGEAFSLRVVGKTEADHLAAELHAACDADPRITALDAYVSDEVLAREVYESELVVLPFTETTNSGSLLLALSLDRPVLVPRSPIVDEIAAEVGPGWVLTYDGTLDADVLGCRARGSSVVAGSSAARPLAEGVEGYRRAPRRSVRAGDPTRPQQLIAERPLSRVSVGLRPTPIAVGLAGARAAGLSAASGAAQPKLRISRYHLINASTRYARLAAASAV